MAIFYYHGFLVETATTITTEKKAIFMMASFDYYFQNSPLSAQRPGLGLEARLGVTLF